MCRIAFLVLCSCVLGLGFLGGPAEAGDYGARYVWYSSSCCYQKVVRHERDVRYVRIGEYRPHYAYYARPPVYVYRAERHRIVQFSEFNYSGVVAYAGEDCYWREVPLRDGRGGWVWGVTTICY
jgi:hypothetical protein